jgi:hypothetical protein
MALCDIKLSGNNIRFLQNQEFCLSANFSISNYLNEEFTIQAIKSNENAPCQILLVDGPDVYDISQPVSFNKPLSFYVKIVLNGMQESLQIALNNTLCDNQQIMQLNLIYGT